MAEDYETLWAACKRGDVAAVTAALPDVSDVNHADWLGVNALHFACGGGHLEVVRLLLKAGADINVATTAGQRALHMAAALGNTELTALLLQEGGDPTQPDAAGRSALQVAKDPGVVALLKASPRVQMSLHDLALSPAFGGPPNAPSESSESGDTDGTTTSTSASRSPSSHAQSSSRHGLESTNDSLARMKRKDALRDPTPAPRRRPPGPGREAFLVHPPSPTVSGTASPAGRIQPVTRVAQSASPTHTITLSPPKKTLKPTQLFNQQQQQPPPKSNDSASASSAMAATREWVRTNEYGSAVTTTSTSSSPSQRQSQSLGSLRRDSIELASIGKRSPGSPSSKHPFVDPANDEHAARMAQRHAEERAEQRLADEGHLDRYLERHDTIIAAGNGDEELARLQASPASGPRGSSSPPKEDEVEILEREVLAAVEAIGGPRKKRRRNSKSTSPPVVATSVSPSSERDRRRYPLRRGGSTGLLQPKENTGETVEVVDILEPVDEHDPLLELQDRIKRWQILSAGASADGLTAGNHLEVAPAMARSASWSSDGIIAAATAGHTPKVRNQHTPFREASPLPPTPTLGADEEVAFVPPPTTPQQAKSSYVTLAKSMIQTGELQGAELLLSHHITEVERAQGVTSIDLVELLSTLGLVRLAENKLDASVPKLLDRCLHICALAAAESENGNALNEPLPTDYLHDLAEALRGAGRQQETYSVLRRHKERLTVVSGMRMAIANVDSTSTDSQAPSESTCGEEERHSRTSTRPFVERVLHASRRGTLQELLASGQGEIDGKFAADLATNIKRMTDVGQPLSRMEMAVRLFKLGDFIDVWESGNRLWNIEVAIQCYEAALHVFTRDTAPEIWAVIMDNLGRACRNRLCGNRSDNIEDALYYYKLGLEVRKQEAFPGEWAKAMHALGVLYAERVCGDPDENTEEAIEYYSKALSVFTAENFPNERASTMNNLAAAYRNRQRGDPALNIEAAITNYQDALMVFTRERNSEKWAMIMNNLGNAHVERVYGDRMENLRAAVEAYKSSLYVRTKEAFPRQWQSTTNNMRICLTEMEELARENGSPWR